MIAEWTGFLPTTKRLVEVESADPALLEACMQACAAREIELLPTPGVLTATGAGLEEDSDAGGELRLDEAFVLAEVEHKGRELFVMEDEDMVYFIGKKREGATYFMPTDEELDAVQATMLKLINEFEEQIVDEPDDDADVAEE